MSHTIILGPLFLLRIDKVGTVLEISHRNCAEG